MKSRAHKIQHKNKQVGPKILAPRRPRKKPPKPVIIELNNGIIKINKYIKSLCGRREIRTHGTLNARWFSKPVP